ncbi:hypothetical protein P7B02_03380 [Caulobacter segnis]|uniref:hypothetical protein n=1 Tax=Caulobacter segnis TaxID=88688 RepID=UPI0024101853|nr:hypothetical protein [Caulobacter segnis]MDG2520573.1 hypothetical protein [Caulobacter segnis]
MLKPSGLDIFLFRSLRTERPTIAALIEDEVALIGTTQDSLFFHGDWTVVDCGFPIPADLPFPNWKVGIDGELRTTNYDGDRHWPMEPSEIELLDFKFSAAPKAFQAALQALNGIGEWLPRYERLTVAYAKRRVTRALEN